MSIFDLTPDRRFLAVLAHPDDEIGCAALLNRVMAAGGQVTVVWAHSTPVREAESRRAFELIGPADLHFLGLPDGEILAHLPTLQARLAEIANSFLPTDAVTMHYEQGHLDHDACCLASHQLGVDRVWEFPMYHTYATRFQHLGRFSDPAGEHLTLLTDPERKLKTRLTHCYPSQTLRRNVVAYQILMLLTLRPTSLDFSERFKVGLSHDWTQPNHRPALAARVRRSANWARWVSGPAVPSHTNGHSASEATRELDSKTTTDIKTFGCTVMHVMEEGDEPGWTYSVGVTKTSKQPEVVVIGVRSELGQFLANEYNLRVREGERFEPGQDYPGFLEGFPVRFEYVPIKHFEDYFGRAIDYYGNKEFKVLQMIVPSTEGVWPWDQNATDSLRKAQPVLSRLP